VSEDSKSESDGQNFSYVMLYSCWCVDNTRKLAVSEEFESESDGQNFSYVMLYTCWCVDKLRKPAMRRHFTCMLTE